MRKGVSVVKPENAITYQCPHCLIDNFSIDTLIYHDSYIHEGKSYMNVETDALDCQYCGKELRIIKLI